MRDYADIFLNIRVNLELISKIPFDVSLTFQVFFLSIFHFSADIFWLLIHRLIAAIVFEYHEYSSVIILRD